MRVRLDGLDALQRQLAWFMSAKAKKHALEAIGSYLRTQAVGRFERQTAPDGSRWQSLAARTVASGARKHGARSVGLRKILTNTGRLRDSITYTVRGTEFVSVDSNVSYAQIHQFGGRAGIKHSARIPARPYLGLAPGDKEVMAELVAMALRKQSRLLAWLNR